MRVLFLAILLLSQVSCAAVPPALSKSEMSYHQAYNIVLSIAREVPMKAADHELAEQALEMLKEAADAKQKAGKK